LKFSAAVRLPVADGVNVTLTVQLLVGVIVALAQVSALMAKSPAFVPLIVTVVKMRLILPVLVTVSVWAALVVFRVWLKKIMPVAEKLTRDPVPVPLRLTV